MERGTEKMSYQKLQDELARLRATMSIQGTSGVVNVNVTTKRESLREVLDLVVDVLRNPRLDASDLEVLKRQIVTSIESQMSEPTALAASSVRRKLAPYAKDDPRYVPTPKESVELYKNASIETIREIHAKYLSNQAGELAIVGDFDASAVKAQLASLLDGWKTQIAYKRIDRPAVTNVPGGLEVIETPDKANAFFFAMQQYPISNSHPDFPALVMGDYILGAGALSSRLGDRIRQKEGLSYGVRSNLVGNAKDDRATLSVYAITNPENKDKLIAVMREEFDRLLKEGVTEEELARAKEGYLQSEAVGRTKDEALAATLRDTIFNDRTMKYYADFEAAIAKTTVEDVNKALRKYVDPEKLVSAVAGDFAKAKK